MKRTDIESASSILHAAGLHDWDSSALERTMADSRAHTFVHEAESEVLAIAVVGAHVVDEAELQVIAVAERARGRGIGRSMLCALLDVLCELGVVMVHLEVRQSNDAALALYQGAGFERVGARSRYYRDGEDAVLLSWRANRS